MTPFYVLFLLGTLSTSFCYDGSDENELRLPKHLKEVYNGVAPKEGPIFRSQEKSYVFSPQKLADIRREHLYWFFDKGGPENRGDLQTGIHSSNQIVHKDLNFPLPFFGFQFNYTRVSLNGFLEFSDPPESFSYPLVFPSKEWPNENDPSFIGIFYSKCRIGRIFQTDYDQRLPGVYYREESNLTSRIDQFGVELRERLKLDIREGIVGAEDFDPKHAIIATWKNVSFSGGIDNSIFITNTFQMVLATDEVHTYAIFNYPHISWVSHTTAGGDSLTGQGGVPAFVGFNAGNGTQSYEYKPYSQSSILRDVAVTGWTNGFPGRHIFRIDERILPGSCNRDIDAAHLPLVIAPESGNMFGGTVVNITGPCFLNPFEPIVCLFDTVGVLGFFVDYNRAVCIQPPLLVQGKIRLQVRVGTGPYQWRGTYFVENPTVANETIHFETDAVYEKSPEMISISWNASSLSQNSNLPVKISLYGYREKGFGNELVFIDDLEYQISNIGFYTIVPANYRFRNNSETADLEVGFIRIAMREDVSLIQRSLWSRPIPLSWYFSSQWEALHGENWSEKLCDDWRNSDELLPSFTTDLSICPCHVEEVLGNKGQFMPDFECNSEEKSTCKFNVGAFQCFMSGTAEKQGAEQQCCYDENGFLLSNEVGASRPKRVHIAGTTPNRVPTLSQWFSDTKALFSCCNWQSELSEGCQSFYEKRPSNECTGYKPPGVAAVFGDPHIVTFDNLQYTFNGMGEFVLLRGSAANETIDVQGRFQQVANNEKGEVMATQMTSIAVQGSNSTVIEVRVRPRDAQWRYRLDVFADSRRIFFDRPNLRTQFFNGLTVYTPSEILNQSHVVIMLKSGVGVEVIESSGFMTARVYLPQLFVNKTRGLLGNFSFDPSDDLFLPDGRLVVSNLNNFENVHRDFGLFWMLSDTEVKGVGRALFTREFGRTAEWFADRSFTPNFIREPRDFLPPNRTVDIERAGELCGESYQCRFDFGMSLNEEMALFTKSSFESLMEIKKINKKK